MPKKRARSRFPKNLLAEGNHGDAFPNDLAVIITSRKTSNETVNNSAVLQDDADFFFQVEKNEVWEVEFILRFTSATAADFKWAWSLPLGATFDGISSRMGGSAAAVADDAFEVVDETGKGIGSLGTGTEAAGWIKGLLVTTSADGLAKFQWAQSAATASDTILLANSYMTRRKVS